jgi:glycosyltransferase involved in cell wall biosynthesis
LKVSVVMPVRNDARNVGATLESLFAQTRLPDEIVVGDGCSTDDTVRIIDRFANRGVPIRVVRNESLFAGGGRNAATRAASHDLLVGIDSGNRADRAWLESMVKPFEEDPTLDYLGGVCYPMLDTWFERSSGAIIYFDDCLGMTWTREELERNARIGLPAGSCMAYRRPIWERAGGFSEWAKKGQDRLFGLRVRMIGGKIEMSLDAVIYFHMARSIGEAFDRHFVYGLWTGRLALPTPRFDRLARIYAAGIGLAAAGLFVPWLLWSIPVLVAAYVYVAAWRKLDVLAKATGKPFSARQRFWAVVILFVRDAAILAGNLLGSLECLVRPRWRRMTRDYLEEGRQPPTTSQMRARVIAARDRR